MIRWIIIKILFFLILVPLLSGEEENEVIAFVDYGIYENEEVDSGPISRTDIIPAELGTRFGFRYILSGIPEKKEIPLIIKTIIPMIKDGEKVFYISEYEKQVDVGKVSKIGYILDYEWELVPGIWTFQILYQDKKLAERKFTLINPH